ncbi:MAG: TRAP transporter large permease [Rhodospirillaceae bacterium]|jgi:tripartite ATP-independent transporter DctM subunit|nr:TRAP transporter large permease [Rhodospirillaceae bacterium]MBT5939419.1 TRAP transporter large permease [Rhodospirillaceae bacterium]MBT7266648.1 TRAP transporter large permease [Rhodospirillaceae bacterium]
MEWYWILALLIGGLVFCMLLGMPVVFAFFTVNLIGAFIFMGGEKGLFQLVRSGIDSVQTFALLPIPLFIFMGEIMFHSGVAARAIDAIDKLISKVPGRLSLVAVIGGTIFSSLSGSTIANTAMLGSTLLPEMYKRGYKPEISIGPIVAVGGIAMLIPPSALAVLLGSVARIPIGDLLVASIIPALILAVMFFAYIIIRCTLNPEIAPAYDVSDLTWGERLKPLFVYVLPLMCIFIVVVGSIVVGIATPTESAALGTVASLIAVAAYGLLSREVFIVSVKQTLKFTVMTLFIICGSITFSQILAFSEASEGLVGLVEAAELAPLTVILVMMVILLFLGCFMDQVSMMMITMPIFMRIVEGTDFGVGDLQQTQVWFGVLALMMLEISLATPPFGLLLFVAKGVAPAGTTMADVISSVLPFILMAMAVAALLVFVPSITLIIPNFIAS